MLIAARGTYYGLLALFPAMPALVSLYGLFAIRQVSPSGSRRCRRHPGWGRSSVESINRSGQGVDARLYS